MKKFEYKTLSTEYATDQNLNSLGGDGWQLVGVTDNKLIFQREKQPLLDSHSDHFQNYEHTR